MRTGHGPEFRADRGRVEGGNLAFRDRSLIAWRSGNSGHLDGFDFRTTDDRLTFTLVLDDFAVAVSQIYVGGRRITSVQYPFTLNR